MRAGRTSVLLFLCSALLTGAPLAAFDDLLKSAGGMFEGAVGSGGGGAASLSDAQIGEGLKEALGIGAERAVAILGQDGGFLEDPQVRIPLPGMLGSTAKTLRAAGQGHYVDEFETAVNRAAERAVPETLAIVKRTVQDMTLQDVRGILSGGDDAATRFLRERAGDSLRTAIRPIVSSATDTAGATAAYKSLKRQADGLLGGFGSLGGLVDTGSIDLDDYVTGKTLDGLFLKLAAEEKRIRHNPVARTTDILKTVFGG